MSTTDLNLLNDPTAAPASRSAGDKLAGCYALSRRLDLGEGVEVWLAHDEVIGKDVSLHFVPEAVRKDSRALQELRLDVKRNRQLIHPNILRVYDLVEEPEWVAISMDAFDGESLAKRIDAQAGKGAAPDEIRPLVGQIASTVEEAHKINVLHRGLAPTNLFLTSTGKLLVTNFGITRTLRDAQVRAGVAEVPSMAYESPQILEGKAPARTDDVYSLGAILYALVTGRPPFGGSGLASQIRAGLTSESIAALGQGDSGVPESWRLAITACLDKKPEARPQSMAEVARRLEGSDTASAPVKSAVVENVPKPAAPLIEQIPAALLEPVKAAPEPVKAAPEPIKAASEPVKAAPEPVKAAPEPVKAAAESMIASATTKTFGAASGEPKRTVENSKPAASSTPPKSPERPFSKDLGPRLYPQESRFPVAGLAIGAVVIAVVALVYYFVTSGNRSTASSAVDQPPEQAELKSLNEPTPPVKPEASPSATETPEPKPQTPPPGATPDLSGSAKAIAERTMMLEKAKTEAQAAEKAHAELLKQQQSTEASLAEVQKGIDEKTKAMEPLKKAADEFVVLRKKMEEDQKAAELAAADAQKMAADKMRLSEESTKALAELNRKNSEKMAAKEQAEMEVATLQKTLVDKQRAVDEGAKALAQAESAKQQRIAVVTENEREVERIKSTDLEAQRRKEAAAAERGKLDRELAEMQRLFKEKMDEIENRRKELEKSGVGPAGSQLQTTPPPATPTIVTPVATPAVMKMATPSPATPEPLKMASLPGATPPALTSMTPAVTETPGGNSLGMRFVPVGDVDFCIWQTRVKDFEVFAKAVNLKSTSWKGPGFKQAPDHPVVNVSWQEAIAFCKWLTDKERKENILPANQYYRLPTDLEWSKAVGLPAESGRTPEMRDMGVPDVYPWGNQWPPPAGAGNYTGEETGSDVAIKGYDDGFAWTAPVGSFAPNKLGLYDMGGNVWQWCMDTWNAESKAKVLRGASWYNGALKLSLLSSCRVHAAPDSSTDNYGFRIVRAKDEAKPGKK